jgi:hypothetical protein
MRALLLRPFLCVEILAHLCRPASCFATLPLSAACRASSSSGRGTKTYFASMASSDHFYPVGVKGKPWGEEERIAWRKLHQIKRSYSDEVLAPLNALQESGDFVVEQYGALNCHPERYPLFAVKSKSWNAANPTVLITGGVHGYETSGVQGALLFLRTQAQAYVANFNLVVAPCVSPWGYEHIQRWNEKADDPNRGFKTDVDRPRDECVALMALIAKLRAEGVTFTAHLDLHETTDTDESEFRPARMARDGEAWKPGTIPDGFYLVADSDEPQAEWQAAIIAAVKKVTHIAPDEQGTILGEKLAQEGVINVPVRALGLCAGITGAGGGEIAPFRTTTEVYPDSPSANDEICNRAQVAAVSGALDFIINSHSHGTP